MKIDHKWVEKNLAGRYTINSDGSYDVNGDVRLPECTTEIVIKFNNVSGEFDCSFSNIESLKGSPNSVGGYFDCVGCNNLKSLEGSPNSVGEDFYCSRCKNLKYFKGCPTSLGGDFFCIGTRLPFNIIKQEFYLDFLLKYGIINEIEYMKRKL